MYAYVRQQDGRESTASLRHLSSVGDERLTEIKQLNIESAAL